MSEANPSGQQGPRDGSLAEAAARLSERWAQARGEAEAPAAENASEEPQMAVEPAEPVEMAEGAPEAYTADEAPISEAEAPESEVAEADAGPTYLTFDDLATDYGIAKNDLMNTVRHRTRVGDEEVDVGLHELVQGYQRGREHEAEMRRLERDRKAWEAEQQQKREALDFAGQTLASVAEIVTQQHENEEREIRARYEHTDWARLRGSDPAEYSARQMEYQTAINSVHQRRQESERKLREAFSTMEAERNRAHAERVEQGRRQLPKYIPGWADAEVANREATEVANYLRREYEASDSDIDQMNDPRAIALAYKAMRYDELQAKGAEVRKRPRQVLPAEPGAGPSPGARRLAGTRKQEAEALGRLRQSGKQDDAARALAARWANRNRR